MPRMSQKQMNQPSSRDIAAQEAQEQAVGIIETTQPVQQTNAGQATSSGEEIKLKILDNKLVPKNLTNFESVDTEEFDSSTSLVYVYEDSESPRKLSIADLTSFITETVAPVGSSVYLSWYDETARILQLELKNNQNQVISTTTLDLPTEQLVKEIRYDAATKELVIVYGETGQETRVPLGSLIQGLATQASVQAVDTKVNANTSRIAVNENAISLLNQATSNLQSGLTTETTNRTAADNSLSSRISTIESDYLKQADKTTLNNSIIAEQTARINADTTLSDAIDLEEIRAKAVEGGLNTRLATVESDYLKQADKTTLTNSITAEQTRATGAENSLSGRISTIENDYLKTADKNALEAEIGAKQDILTFDNTPTANSNNPVTSKGIKSYVDNNGGRIDKIKVNSVEQTIVDKTVNITVPTKTSDITNDSGFITSSYHDNTKQDTIIAGENVTINDDNKTINAPKNAYLNIKQLDDYLYEAQYSTKNIDYDYANAYFKSAPPTDNIGSGCTGVVKDGRVLRQLDWYYDNNVEFVVRTDAEYDKNKNIVKHASIGIASAINDLTKDLVQSGAYSRKFKMVPFIMTDGINDAGLYIQSNVVPYLAFDINPTATQECCITMVIRYILDHCASFADVETFFNTYHIYGTSAVKYNYHFLLAQGDQWEVIELTTSGHTTVTKGTGTNQMPYGIMTNFRTTGLTFTPTEGRFPPNFVNWDTVETYGIGVERYDIVTTALNAGQTLEQLRPQLMYTKTYTNLTEPIWRTEFASESDGLTVMDAINAKSKYNNILTQECTHYANRNRNEGANSVWQTTHSSIYDLNTKSINVVIQERENKEFNFKLVEDKQDKLASQTAYSQKGTATKVPQITTNNLGQVTGITEVDISLPASVTVSSTGVTDGINTYNAADKQPLLTSANAGNSITITAATESTPAIIAYTNTNNYQTATQMASAISTHNNEDLENVHPAIREFIEDEIENRELACGALSDRLDDVEAVIPNQATSQNPLADKAFVNSTVQTATANFRGNWETWSVVPTDSSLYPEDYAGSKIPTTNDYLVIKDASDYEYTTTTVTTTNYSVTKGASSYVFTLTYPDSTTSSVTHVNTTAGQPIIKYLGKNNEFEITAIGNASHTIKCIYDVVYNGTTYPAGSIIATSMYYNAFNISMIATIQTIVTKHCEGTWRFKYTGVWATSWKNGWKNEYQINETPMTAAQLAAINSGITSSKVSTYDGYTTSKLDKVTTASKVYGTDASGNQTTYDAGSFGQVDDVKFNGSTVVSNKIATIPYNLSSYNNDAGFLTQHQSLTNYVTTNTVQTIAQRKTFAAGITVGTGNGNGVNLGTWDGTAAGIESLGKLGVFKKGGTDFDTIFGFFSGYLNMGHTDFALRLRGSAARPAYFTNNTTKDIALSEDITTHNSANNAHTDIRQTISNHTSATNNPHSVTAAQVGLGNVENKSSATIRSEITSSNVTIALGFTPQKPVEIEEL